MISSTIGAFVAQRLLVYGMDKGWAILFKKNKTYKKRLTALIDKTIEEYSKENPIATRDKKFPFYGSQVIIEELLKYRFFKNNNYLLDQDKISNELKENPNIIQPEKKEIENFLELFESNIKNDEELKVLAIEANFKEEIFNISETLHSIIVSKLDEILIISKDNNKDTAEIKTKVNIIQSDINLLLSKSKEDEPKLNNKIDDSILPKEVEKKIKEAKIANRLGKYELSTEIWNDIAEIAKEQNNQKLSIRVRLELAMIEIRDDSFELEDILKIANDCLSDSKKINLGNQVGDVLQLLGELHRLIGNADLSRGFLNASLEFSKLNNVKELKGWALLALSMLSRQNKESLEVQLNHINQAYDSFTDLLLSGKENAEELANNGYAFCHLLRAEIHNYKNSEEALSEYSRAIAIYRKMDESWEFELARALLERGEMQANKTDWKPGVQDIIDAEKIFNKLDNPYWAAKCILASAQLLDNIGFREEAENYYRSALQKVIELKNERKKGWFFLRYAMKLMEVGKHDIAKEILLMLLSNESINDSKKLDVLKMLSDLAKISKDEKELKEYEEYTLTIIEKLISEAQSSKERLRLLYNKGHSLSELQQYELALETFQRVMRLAETLSANDRIPEIWAAIAEVHNKMKNPKEERLAYENALRIIGDNENSPHLATTLIMVAQIEIKEDNLEEAKKLLDRAEKVCKKIMPFMMFVVNDIRQKLAEAESKMDAKSKKKK